MGPRLLVDHTPQVVGPWLRASWREAAASSGEHSLNRLAERGALLSSVGDRGHLGPRQRSRRPPSHLAAVVPDRPTTWLVYEPFRRSGDDEPEGAEHRRLWMFHAVLSYLDVA